MMNGIDLKKFETLSAREKLYFKMMYGQSGLLYITAEPGVAKSAIMKSIADKMDMQYIDIRLTLIDEIDVGLFPYRKDVKENGKTLSLLSYAIPEWAHRSNLKPTIIHFEELNRAQRPVRNAAFQIFLERAIGYDFKFNDNVYMVASGNLGEKDGTDVEEFDRALNNRLIHRKHTLTLPEWIENYATENIHSDIINFLKNNEEHFLHANDVKLTNNSEAYATPRSWTYLSNYIVKNYGMNASVDEFIDDIRDIGAGYVGDGANSRFIRYLDESMRFTINDIINNFDGVKHQLKDLSRDKKSELLNTLKQKVICDFNEKQIENIKRFVLTLSDDEAISYILKILDTEFEYLTTSNENDNEVINSFLTDPRLDKYLNAASKHVYTQKEATI